MDYWHDVHRASLRFRRNAVRNDLRPGLPAIAGDAQSQTAPPTSSHRGSWRHESSSATEALQRLFGVKRPRRRQNPGIPSGAETSSSARNRGDMRRSWASLPPPTAAGFPAQREYQIKEQSKVAPG